MVDADALAKALGGDGKITFDTERQRGTIEVTGGRVWSSILLKNTISAAAVKESNRG